MDRKIRIAVDAMGGDGSPKKIIDGISDHNKKSKNIHYLIFDYPFHIKLFEINIL